MNFKETQAGKVAEAVKLAYLSHTPFVHIVTNELELCNRIFDTRFCSIIQPCRIQNSVKQLSNYQYKNTFKLTDYEKMPILNVIVTPSAIDPSDALQFLNLYLNLPPSSYSEKTSYSDTAVANARKSLWVTLSPSAEIPKEIAAYTQLIFADPLSDEEIAETIGSVLDDFRIPAGNGELVNRMTVSFRGFGKGKIRQALEKMIVAEYLGKEDADEEKIFKIIQAEKKQLLDKSEGLRWETYTDQEASGLAAISDWLDERIDIFNDIEHARRQGIDAPKGVLISGIPGSGKSLMAKFAASKLGLPLISMDMGALMGGIVGSSEHNMIEALRMAETMAPCVLWIDEIEKAFSGAKSSQSDGGVAQRMFGRFLTWMQEKTAACFVFATSNDITDLPSELFRSERFDRKFYTFMPSAAECCEIFAGNIRYQNRVFRKEQEKSAPFGSHGLKQLFSTRMEDPAFWLPILETACLPNGCELEQDKKNGAWKWKDNRKPKNKLLTGADISVILKEAKFAVFKQRLTHESKTAVYSDRAMEQAVRKVVAGFSSYGETNLKNIVKCFLKLHENEFDPASGRCIIDFSRYDDDDFIYHFTEQDTANLKSEYDKVLLKTLTGAINRYAEDLVCENTNRTRVVVDDPKQNTL